MSVRMYKNKNSKRVRGLNVQAHLDTGWTFEPIKQTKLKPTKRTLPKFKLEVGEVEVKSKTDLSGPKDLTTEE